MTLDDSMTKTVEITDAEYGKIHNILLRFGRECSTAPKNLDNDERVLRASKAIFKALGAA